MRSISRLAVCLLGCIVQPVQATNISCDVEFKACGEYVGLGLVPLANARALVPSQYTLAEQAGQAQLVVRVASCGAVSVDGKHPQQARTAQIGLTLAAQAEPADIDNYLLWYVTDSGVLHGKLEAAGLQNGNDQQLSFVFAPSGGTGPLSIDVNAPRFPAYPVSGQASSSTAPPIRYVANWFADGRQGKLRMHTVFPDIRFGTANATLTTDPSSELGALIGSGSLAFAVNLYNEWEDATMELRPQ